MNAEIIKKSVIVPFIQRNLRDIEFFGHGVDFDINRVDQFAALMGKTQTFADEFMDPLNWLAKSKRKDKKSGINIRTFKFNTPILSDYGDYELVATVYTGPEDFSIICISLDAEPVQIEDRPIVKVEKQAITNDGMIPVLEKKEAKVEKPKKEKNTEPVKISDFIFHADKLALAPDEQVVVGTNLTVVAINTKQCWENHHQLTYDYTETEWEFLRPILDELGLGEFMESIFATNESPEEITKKMLERGFEQDPEFNKHMDVPMKEE